MRIDKEYGNNEKIWSYMIKKKKKGNDGRFKDNKFEVIFKGYLKDIYWEMGKGFEGDEGEWGCKE